MNALASNPNPLLCGFRLPRGLPAASVHYRIMRKLCQISMCSLWNVRVFNRHHEPAEGGVVYICNHQSFFDPMLIGMGLRRPVNYMARDTLFHHLLLGRLIASVNAFPVRRGTADLGALKEAMRRLRAGGQVAIFAEGTRTRDGRIGPFLPGVAMLVRRAAKWTVPVLIDGAFEAWPRTQLLPSRGSVVVQYAPPIPQDEARSLRPQNLLNRVREILIDMQADVRRRVGRPPLRYDRRQGEAK